MMIRTQWGNEVMKIREATAADVKRLALSAGEREIPAEHWAVISVVGFEDERIAHWATLRADGGMSEVWAAVEAQKKST